MPLSLSFFPLPQTFSVNTHFNDVRWHFISEAIEINDVLYSTRDKTLRPYDLVDTMTNTHTNKMTYPSSLPSLVPLPLLLPPLRYPEGAYPLEQHHLLSSDCNVISTFRAWTELYWSITFRYFERSIITQSHSLVITPSYLLEMVTVALSDCTSHNWSNWATRSPTFTCLKLIDNQGINRNLMHNCNKEWLATSLITFSRSCFFKWSKNLSKLF